MLETEIQKLTKAMLALTDAINAASMAPAPVEAPAVEPVVEQPVVEQPTALAVEPVAPAVEPTAPSANIEALQTRCLELTRIDRANSPKIKAIIATYGAAVLKDVPADNLGELAAKLEALA